MRGGGEIKILRVLQYGVNLGGDELHFVLQTGKVKCQGRTTGLDMGKSRMLAQLRMLIVHWTMREKLSDRFHVMCLSTFELRVELS